MTRRAQAASGAPGSPRADAGYPVRPNPYRQALDATVHAILWRSRWFRNLVVGMVLTAAAAGALTWTIGPSGLLPGMLAASFLCVGFIIVDARLLVGWLRAVLDLWCEGGLELQPLQDAVESMPMLPPRTVQGMLGLLPRLPGEPPPPPPGSPVRRGLARATRELYVLQAGRAVLVGSARLLGLACGAAAVFLGAPAPLLGLLVVPSLLLAPRAFAALRLRVWRRDAVRLAPAAADRAELARRVASIDWSDAGSGWPRRLVGVLEAGAAAGSPGSAALAPEDGMPRSVA